MEIIDSLKQIIECFNSLANPLMNFVTIGTFIAAVKVSNKVNGAVDKERLSRERDDIIGTLNSFIRKMENEENCTDNIINQLKCFLQETTNRYRVLKSIRTTILIFYLDKFPKHNSFKIRNDLTKLRAKVERIV